jgi:hypothetical protein
MISLVLELRAKGMSCRMIGRRLGMTRNAVAGLIWRHRHAGARRSPTGRRGRLTEALVREIRASDEPVATLAARHGVAGSTIARARSGDSWAHVQ